MEALFAILAFAVTVLTLSGAIVFLIKLVRKTIRVVKPNTRFASFRLGRFQRVLGPGLVFTIPWIDRLLQVDLDTYVPSWQMLSEDHLNQQVQALIMDEQSPLRKELLRKRRAA